MIGAAAWHAVDNNKDDADAADDDVQYDESDEDGGRRGP